MFTLNVRKLFRNAFGSWETATPPRREARPTFRPGLEVLEERCCPSGGVPDAGTSMSFFWDPTQTGNLASSALNWDKDFLGSPTHPPAAPGQTLDETDNVYFDGSNSKGNQNCTWDYTPKYAVGALTIQHGWTQTIAFQDKQGFSISATSMVTDKSAPTITPNGSSGSSAVAAITLTNGAYIAVLSSTLFLQGYSSGNAVFFAGDGKAGEKLFNNEGTVSYLGKGSTGTAYTDYLKIPVQNEGVFKVNGNGSSSTAGAVLQVSGSNSDTRNASFYQDTGDAETDLSGMGTLWCVNNYLMTKGKLQTTDAGPDILMVGTGGSSPVDGSVTLIGGTVNIDAYANGFGTLQIMGTTDTNAPTLNLGGVTLNFNVNMTEGKNDCSKLIVGKANGTGKVNFGYNSTTTTVAIHPQGTTTKGHRWQIIFFGSRTGDVTLSPTSGFTKLWNITNLEIDN